LIENIEQVQGEKIVIVCVHAHVGLPQCLKAVSWTNALGIVIMPCCNWYAKLTLDDKEPIQVYEDHGVISPHRLVRVYRLTEPLSPLPPAAHMPKA